MLQPTAVHGAAAAVGAAGLRSSVRAGSARWQPCQSSLQPASPQPGCDTGWGTDVLC